MMETWIEICLRERFQHGFYGPPEGVTVQEVLVGPGSPSGFLDRIEAAIRSTQVGTVAPLAVERITAKIVSISSQPRVYVTVPAPNEDRFIRHGP